MTRLTDASSIDEHPAWSPDGSRIVFESASNGNRTLQEIAADGSWQHPLVNAPWQQADAHWSPDGKLVAFSSDVDGNRDIYTVNADCSNLTRLSDDPHSDSNPVWSRDGSLIAFVSTRDGQPGIYVMNADGTAPARVSPPGARTRSGVETGRPTRRLALVVALAGIGHLVGRGVGGASRRFPGLRMVPLAEPLRLGLLRYVAQDSSCTLHDSLKTR